MLPPAEMAVAYKNVRAAVLQVATRPTPYDAKAHAANQMAFQAKLAGLLDGARLRPDLADKDLWNHVWPKVRYAGIRAKVASTEVKVLEEIFGNYEALGTPEWRHDPAGQNHGERTAHFLAKTGPFSQLVYNRHGGRLEKILRAAAVFRRFPDGVPAVEALFGPGYTGPSDESVWRAHERLAKLIGFTTALHAMMDLGFPVVKPDIVLVTLMCRLGWIEDVFLRDTPHARIRRFYRRPDVAAAVVKCARGISGHLGVPLREIDFVMVKYGQEPGEFGIVRNLHRTWLPIQRIADPAALEVALKGRLDWCAPRSMRRCLVRCEAAMTTAWSAKERPA